MKRIISSLVVGLMLLLAFVACQPSQDPLEQTDSEQTEHSHNWLNATCTAPRVCQSCGETEGTSLGHSFNEATCTTPSTCTRCKTTTGDVADHTYSAKTTNPTCSQKGYTTYTCKCGEYYIDNYTDVIDHTYGAWQTTKNASCTENGTQKRYCTYCNHSEENTLPATGHTEVIDQAVAPTCTSTGLTEGKHCSKCQIVFTSQTIIPKTTHNVEHGTCVTCKMIYDAYDALAYYVLCNGDPNDKGDEYCIMNRYCYESSEYYYYIYTDKNASTLSFRMLVYSSNAEIFLMMDVVRDSNVQEALMGYKSLGYTDYTRGKIYANTFSSSNKYLFDFEHEGFFTSLASKYKSIFANEISLMLGGIELFIIDYYDIQVTLPMLGFNNY